MKRLQFTLRALLVLLLAVACFFGGIAFQKREVNEMRNAMLEQKDISAMLAKQFRETVQQLMDAQNRIRQLETGSNAGNDAVLNGQ
jgi:Tfp pilus assembly protein PilN